MWGCSRFTTSFFLVGTPETPQTGINNNNYDRRNTVVRGNSDSSQPVFDSIGVDIRDNQSIDLDKLARAVAQHETAGCTKGSAKVRNCFGIMSWTGGKRHFKVYATKEASYEDFKRIWAKSYKVFPNLALAKKYSGNDRAKIWLNNVTKFYNQN